MVANTRSSDSQQMGTKDMDHMQVRERTTEYGEPCARMKPGPINEQMFSQIL